MIRAQGVVTMVKKNIVAMTAFYLTAVDSFSQRVTNYLSLDPQQQQYSPRHDISQLTNT